jgi:hypothetical protein
LPDGEPLPSLPTHPVAEAVEFLLPLFPIRLFVFSFVDGWFHDAYEHGRKPISTGRDQVLLEKGKSKEVANLTGNDGS